MEIRGKIERFLVVTPTTPVTKKLRPYRHNEYSSVCVCFRW